MEGQTRIKKLRNNNWLEIRKVLNRCGENNLIGLIAELYSLSKSNKDFLEARFLQDHKAIERYKAQIKRYVAPNEPWKESQRISLKDAKKVLSDYKKATNDKIGLIDLMLHYVECGTQFLCDYGDMYEQYYSSLESVFDNALKFMQEHKEHDIQDYIDRSTAIVKKAKHMGWGYYDNLLYMRRKAYPIS